MHIRVSENVNDLLIVIYVVCCIYVPARYLPIYSELPFSGNSYASGTYRKLMELKTVLLWKKTCTPVT